MEAPESKVLDTTPSAPMPTDAPSAPPSAPIDTFQSNECVVCLEKKVILVYNYFLGGTGLLFQSCVSARAPIWPVHVYCLFIGLEC